MKALVINAAPRMEAGNTQMILNPFVVGMRNGGAEVNVAILGRMNLKRCVGCFTCYAKTPGKCVHDDDMPSLTARISQADMMVLATPVYLDGMTSLCKTLVDRLVVFLEPHYVEDAVGLRHPLRWNFPHKLFLLSVCGYPGLRNFEPLVLHMERMARNFHAEFVGALLRPAVFSCLMTNKYPDRIKKIMDAVRAVGGALAKSGRVSKNSLDAAAADVCSVEELKNTANAYWDRELLKHQETPA